VKLYQVTITTYDEGAVEDWRRNRGWSRHNRTWVGEVVEVDEWPTEAAATRE
jgi:hypothetical protein